ncbi:Ail/Lom family outer membrane beta-barrel protein, partial [Escherichia coli]|nr:Ail/Lom family outer membrane beta-barrel protein [Escherichia coli]
MKHARIIFACTTFVMSFVAAPACAAQGDSTVSFGYAHLQLSGLNNFVKDLSLYNLDTFNRFTNRHYFNSGEYADASVRGHDGKGKSPQGMSIRYRYEITDEIGVITSFTWARSMT